MGLLHEARNRVEPLPCADLAVVEFAVVGEHGSEKRPVASVDSGGGAYQQIGDMLWTFSFGHRTSRFGWTTMRGGPSDLRARSSAAGTSSRPMILPTLGSGSSRP